jgi:hypothetical protein
VNKAIEKANAQLTAATKEAATARKRNDAARIAAADANVEVARARVAFHEARLAVINGKGDAETRKAAKDALAAALERQVERPAFFEFNCEERQVFCLDMEGTLFDEEDTPTLRPGEAFRVRVVGPNTTTEAQIAAIHVSVGHVLRSERLFAPVTDANGFRTQGNNQDDKNEGGDSEDQEPSAPPALKVLSEVETRVLDEESVLVDFERLPATAEELRLVEGYTLTIDHGRYFLQFGLGVPFVINGDRKVTTAPFPGTGERFSVIQQDVYVNAALMLNFFPFGGRRNGQVWFCTNGCRWGDALGFQFGTELDTRNPFEQWYLGAVFEPITGMSVNGGLALVKGQFLSNKAEEGSVITGTGDPETITEFMPRPYVGLTLTTDILQTLSEARTRLNGLPRN